MTEAEIDAWLTAAPVHQVRAAHTEAALAIGEWRQRLCRPEERCLLSISLGRSSRSITAAAGRAAMETAIIVVTWRQHRLRRSERPQIYPREIG
jgi:hypothetical protein